MTAASKPTVHALPAADKNLPKLKDDRLADIVAQNAAFVVHVDARGRLLATAESTVALLGYPAAYLAQVSLQDLVMPEHVRELEELMALVSSTGEPQKAAIPFLRADEGCYWLDLSVQLAQGPGDKNEPRFDVFGYDVTSWVRKEHQLRDESRRDPLTGMSNRAHLREWMIESIDNGVASGKAFAVMMLDLDGFKRINDSLGHDIGDALLRAVGKRLKAQLHQDDVFARLGADEFVLVAGNLDESDTWDRLAARIVAAMQRPFSVGGQQLRVTFSIGIALYPEDGLKSSQLLKHADLAMYSAKDRGKNQFVFYSSDLEKVKAEAFSLEQDMLSGIRTGEFELHYQPIVDARTREVLAAEALMRWNHPQGQRPPTAFIPLAEDNGLINLLGSWALRMVCAQLARWDANGISLAYVGVNVSPVQFQNPAFSQSVMSAVRESGIDPGRLVLEITEGTLMIDPIDFAKVPNSAGLAPALKNHANLTVDGKAYGLSWLWGMNSLTVRKGIAADDHRRTSVPHIYAVGDCAGYWQLAHTAFREGEVAAENACGHDAVVDNRAVPRPIYTDPQIAGVGLTEAQARELHGDDVAVGTFPWPANSRAVRAISVPESGPRKQRRPAGSTVRSPTRRTGLARRDRRRSRARTRASSTT